jgi:hypothetical protein
MGAWLSAPQQLEKPPERITIRAALERVPDRSKESVEAVIKALEAAGYNCEEEDVNQGFHELQAGWLQQPPYCINDKQAVTLLLALEAIRPSTPHGETPTCCAVVLYFCGLGKINPRPCRLPAPWWLLCAGGTHADPRAAKLHEACLAALRATCRCPRLAVLGVGLYMLSVGRVEMYLRAF